MTGPGTRDPIRVLNCPPLFVSLCALSACVMQSELAMVKFDLSVEIRASSWGDGALGDCLVKCF